MVLKPMEFFQTQAEIDDLNALAFNEKGVSVEYVKGAKVGDLKFVDLNGDGRITEEEIEHISEIQFLISQWVYL